MHFLRFKAPANSPCLSRQTVMGLYLFSPALLPFLNPLFSQIFACSHTWILYWLFVQFALAHFIQYTPLSVCWVPFLFSIRPCELFWRLLKWPGFHCLFLFSVLNMPSCLVMEMTRNIRVKQEEKQTLVLLIEKIIFLLTCNGFNQSTEEIEY